MLGFLSHLILDEIYAYDFSGFRLKPNKFAGSAFKFISPSWFATLTCYTLLIALGWYAWVGGAPAAGAWPTTWPRPSWLHAGQALAP